MYYGDLRWTDIEQLDKSRFVVVAPLAALEQHGHHLPLLTDTYLVTAVAERVHEHLGDNILLAPTFWCGASDHHLDFPGTLSLPNSLYVEVIKSLVRCYVRAGFRRVLFLNGHGGNVAPGETAITEMANSCDLCDSALIALGSYWTIADNVMQPEQHGMDSPRLTHACEYETSMMLAVQGETVHLNAARGVPLDAPSSGKARIAGRFHRLSETGALGSPEKATAEKGESLLSAIGGEVAAYVRQLAAWPLRDVRKSADLPPLTTRTDTQ